MEVRGLTKRFGTLTADDGLDFSVEPGRITGFLGPSGAGRTTTLRILLGLVRPTAGTAMVGGSAFAGSPTQLLNWWGGALVLAGYGAVMAGVGSWLSVRRDIT